MTTAIQGLVLTMLIGCYATQATAEKWEIDTAHSNVGFSVRHFFTSVQGRFNNFEGMIDFDPNNPQKLEVKGTVMAASINTNEAERDEHLRSADFFDVEKYPTLAFESTELKEWSGKKGKLAGKLTLHGTTRPVVLDVAYLGRGPDPWGNVLAGFRATLAIDRNDYGLTWNKLLETGGFLVGNTIDIRIDVEGILAE